MAESVTGSLLLYLRHIDSTNPTLAEQMHNCMLRAGLSHRNAGNSESVITHPSAWLGTAYHYVLEKAAELDPGSIAIEEKIVGYWDAKITELYEASKEHPLNRRWGPPDSWRNYRFTRGMACLKAKDLINQNPTASGGSYHGGDGRTEQFLRSSDGRLVGQPDVVSGDSVLDYKSGYILELSDGVEALRESYVRQLKLYAYLIHENQGYWPSRGVVDAMKGGRMEVTLEPLECEDEAAKAIELLNLYNSSLETGLLPETLASPSPEACRWCPFQLVCPPFWEQVSPRWYEVMQTAAVEGQLLESPQMSRDGLAYSISVNPQAGTEIADGILVKPFEANMYKHLEGMDQNDSVRVVGAYRKSNRTLGISPSTLVSSLTLLPAIKIDVS